MKKLYVWIWLLLSLLSVLFVYAADDLWDLDSLLNDQDLIWEATDWEVSVTSWEVSVWDDITVTENKTKVDNIVANTWTTVDVTSNEETDMQKGTNWDTETIESNTVSKILLSLTWEVNDTTVTLTFTKVGDYTDYKIYYTKDGEETLSEKEVKLQNNENVAVVTIDGLEQDTTYQFVAKAFDADWNPIETTVSDTVKVTTKKWETVHSAPADNVIYSPVVKVEWKNITVTWKPGVDVKKVQISISEDAKVFKPIATVDVSTTSYTIPVDKTGKKYIKLVPIAEDWTLWVCKLGATDVQFVSANVELKKQAEAKMWHPKTGPETYVLIIIAILSCLLYAIRRRKA